MAKKKEGLTYEEKLEKSLVQDWEQPYKVPSNWIWTRLTDIVNVKTGKKDANYATEDGNFAFFTCAAEPLRCNDFSFEGESILVAGNGANVGLSLYYDGKFEAYQRTYVLQKRGDISLKYVFYHLNCFWKDYNADKQYGSATNYIKLGNFESYPVSLPPLAEQQRIVERIESLFSKLDEAKEKAQIALDSFEIRKVAILYKAFTGELSKKWREENGMSLGSWEKIPFEKIIESGPQNGLYKPQSAYGSGIKIIRIDSFYNGDIEPWSTIKQLQLVEAEINTYKLEIGDILVNRVNSMPYLGKSALIRELPEICVFESNIMRLTLDTKKALPEYIICYLNSSIGLEELKKNAKQAVNQASINQQDVKSAMISLPTVPEQLEIVRILDSIFGKERQAKEFVSVIDKIDNMKKSILARAFRGELGTNNPEEDSALKLLKEILSKENKTKQKPNKKTITIPSHISKQFKTDLEEQIYKIILEKQNSTLNQILSSISSSKHLDAMEVIAILYERGLINKRDDLYSTK